MAADRRDLIVGLWPDKLLYGAVTLLLVGLTGVVWGLLVGAGEIRYGAAVPEALAGYPVEVTVLASAGAAGLGLVALARRATPWGFAGALLGVAAVGFLGVGAALSLLALAFFGLSRAEGEERNERTLRLTADLWPDKSLAAALLGGIHAALALAWGTALLTDQLTLARLAPWQDELGWLALAAGLLGVAATVLLYYQRGAPVGVVAAVLGLAVFPFFVVGPLLALAQLALLGMAWKEREFRRPAAEAALAPR